MYTNESNILTTNHVHRSYYRISKLAIYDPCELSGGSQGIEIF